MAHHHGRWTFTGLALLLFGLAGWWAEPGLAQVGGDDGTFTTTTSTTSHNTYTSVSAPAPCPPPVGVLNHTETSITTTTTFGPATILIGDDQSETFFVEAGTTNVNTNTHTEYFYDCIGAAPVPAASPFALGGLVLLLLGLGVWTLARRT